MHFGSGTRKFIDLTDPQLTQNKARVGVKYLLNVPKNTSPRAEAKQNKKESSLAPKHSKNDTKTTLNRCNSAIQGEEQKFPRAMSPKISNAIKGILHTTRGRNFQDSNSFNKNTPVNSLLTYRKQNLQEDIPKKIPNLLNVMITASRSLAILKMHQEGNLPLMSSKECEKDLQNNKEQEDNFQNQLNLKGRARVKSLQVMPPSGKNAISPHTQKKIQINIDEDFKSKATTNANEKPTFVRLNKNNSKGSAQTLKMQQFLTQKDEKQKKIVPIRSSNILDCNKKQSLQILVRIQKEMLTQKVGQNKCIQLIDDPVEGKLLKLKNSTTVTSFKFDNVLNESLTQQEVFKESSEQIVQSFIQEGACGTIFAYGKTDAGKTFTLIGEDDVDCSINSSMSSSQQPKNQMANFQLSKNEKRGILPRIIDYLFTQDSQRKDKVYLLSYFEIFNEKVFDLLQPISIHSHSSTPSSQTQNFSQSTLRSHQQDSLEVIEGKNGYFSIPHLKRIEVKSKSDAYALLELGLQSRKVRSTLMSISSSRCHSIFQIEDISKPWSKLRIVDLASSENNIQTQDKPNKKQKELVSIHKSLQILEQCFQNFGKTSKINKIPFKSCKLTQILKESLLQHDKSAINTMAALILCVSPFSVNYQETLSTLQLSDQKAVVIQSIDLPNQTEKMSQEQVHQMITELEHLKTQNRNLQDQVQIYKKTLISPQQFSDDSNSQFKKKPIIDHQPSQDKNQNMPKTLEKSQARPSSVFQEQPKPDAGIDATISLEDIREDLPLKSIFKHGLSKKHKKVQFKQKLLDNNSSLNSSIKERVEHNLKYNDDTIFANLDIFKDIGEVSHKVHGKKDKFNASSLLAVKFQDISVSDDEQKCEYENDLFEEKPIFKVDESLSIIKNNNEYDSIGDSIKRPNIIKGLEQINAEIAYMSEDMSQDLLELNQDQQFQQAFKQIVAHLNEGLIEKQNSSMKIFDSLLDAEEGEESNSNILFYSERNLLKEKQDQAQIKQTYGEQNNSNGEQRPFLDELSNIMYRGEFENNLTNQNLNDEAPAQQRQNEQQQNFFVDQQQQSTLILDEEEVGAAQSHGGFEQEDNAPMSEEKRENDCFQSVLPSFDASRILPAQQNDLSLLINDPKHNNFFAVSDDKKRKLMTEEQKENNNESEDCNLTIGEKPSYLIRGLGGIINQQQKPQGITVGGVTGKFQSKKIDASREMDQDVTKLANECS